MREAQCNGMGGLLAAPMIVCSADRENSYWMDITGAQGSPQAIVADTRRRFTMSAKRPEARDRRRIQPSIPRAVGELKKRVQARFDEDEQKTPRLLRGRDSVSSGVAKSLSGQETDPSSTRGVGPVSRTAGIVLKGDLRDAF